VNPFKKYGFIMSPTHLKRLAVAVVCLAIMTGCASSQWKKEQAGSHINVGIAFLGAERFNDALREFMQAKEYTPRDPQVHYYMGIAYYSKGLNNEALQAFREAVSIKPDYSEAHNFAGTIYLGMGQWEKAIDAFKKALSNVMYETPDKALFNMGRAYHGKGDYQMALDQYAEAKKRKPSTIPSALLGYHMGLASYAQENFYQASQYFRQVVEEVPSFLESRYWLGQCYLKMRYWDQAREQFRFVIKAIPESELGKEAQKSLDTMGASK
jgi:tetratricopeptide (TPR) repeat protein